MRRGPLRALAAAALLLLAGCGWHAGLVAPEAAAGATSVGVEVFGNTSREPEVEADLAAEVARAVSDWVELDYAASGRADLVVRGTVLDYRRRDGIRSADNELLEGSVRVEASARLERRADGEVLATARSGLWADWAIGDPGGEATARARVVRNLADRLVLELFAPAH